jgi:hypothetical protein
MTGKVFLHIGPPKTASTYLQQILDRNAEVLRDRGICVPGTSAEGHVRGALEVMGRQNRQRPTSRGQWKELVQELAGWSGPSAVVSCELFAAADARAVDRIVGSLEPAEVHVVYMARDLSKVVPGMWQTLMRTTGTVSWETYLASVRGDTDAPRGFGARFWRQQDPRFALARWEHRVPRERIHVVTVPPSGTDPSVLWSRFCDALGVDPEGYSFDVRRSNESLGSAEADLLRRINARLAGEVSRVAYDRWIKFFVSRRVLERREGARRIALPAREHSWIRPRAEEIGEFLQTHGYDLVGDTRDLLPAAVPEGRHAPDDVDVEEVLDAAVDVIARLVRKAAGEGRGDRAETGPRRSPARDGAAGVSPGARVRAALGRRTGLPARWRSRR